MKTIVALSTAPMNSAIHIIRVSGDKAFDIVNTIVSLRLIKKGYIIQKSNIVNHSKIIDHVLINTFVAPKSFTGEDLIEINCHGGIYLARQIIQLLISKGCTQALNGEFSQRAFMNGKISLNEAESINNLINATSDYGVQLANNGLSLKTIKSLNLFKQELFKLLGQVEVNIDYPEFDDVPDITPTQFNICITKLIKQASQIINLSKQVMPIREGLNIAIIGKPNVGKSSLLNAILNEERVIVSNTPGTTRDVVKEQVNINGITFNFLDTAGLRLSKNQIEKIGINKTNQSIQSADLILWIVDGSKPLNQLDRNIQRQLHDKKYLVVINKSDLIKKVNINGITISAKKQNIHNLIKAITKFVPKIVIKDDSIVLQSSRSIALMEHILHELNIIKTILKNKQPIDLSAEHLHLAYENILNILGNSEKYSFTNELFRKFCVGK